MSGRPEKPGEPMAAALAARYASAHVPRKSRGLTENLAPLRHSPLQRSRWERAAQIADRDLSDWIRRTLDREASAVLDRKPGRAVDDEGDTR